MTIRSPTPIPTHRDYPVGIHEQSIFTTSAEIQRERFMQISPDVFSNEIKAKFIDLRRENGSVSCITKVCGHASAVEDILAEEDSKLPRVRIISLHSANTTLPLRITDDLMSQILTRYRVDPAFLSVLFSFGDEPNLTESAETNFSSRDCGGDNYNLSYQLRYAEQNYRSKDRPWSIRQTGVYHHHSLQFDLFIFLNPLEESVVESQLLAFGQANYSQHPMNSVIENPLQLHVLPFVSYLSNWRWYLRYLGDQFERKNDPAMTLDLKTVAAIDLGFDSVQSLRDLQDIVLSLGPFCKGGIDVIRALQHIDVSGSECLRELDIHDTQLDGHVRSLGVLSERIRNLIELWAYALKSKDQYTAAQINDHMADLTERTTKLTEKTSHLTEKTTHDSATIKWLTFLTLIYLPASFVATLYGMNLFVFDQQTRKIVIANDFWIYVVTWIPLTLLTFLGYWAVVALHRDPSQKGSWLGKFG